MVVHNRYRSAAPSGENRVVDTERQALQSAGHEVIPFERESDEIERWSRPQQATLPARVVYSRQARRDLARALTAHRPDVVHVHNTFPLLSPTVLYACKDAAVPVVATLHNYKLACASGDFFRNGAPCHDCAGRLGTPAVQHGCYRGSRAATVPVTLSTGLHRQAWRSLVAAYVFISAAQRDLLSDLRLDSQRVFVRHNLIPHRQTGGVQGSRPPMAEPHAGTGRHPADSQPVVVYAGRLDEAKGMRLLMAGWDRYLADAGHDHGLRLVVAGAGPLDQEMAGWAATHPSVLMLGLVDPAACAELISTALAIVVPSAWEETFGLVVVEAMAAAVPAIGAGHGSLPELITHGSDGVLFRAGDPAALAAAFAEAAASPAQFRHYGELARKTYEQRFDPDQNLAQLLEIYRFAISHPVPVKKP
jgi:glycosyltransferase involved in cell wall biosynthesis